MTTGDDLRSEAAAIEERLRAAEARFEGIIEISADAIISVDDAQRVRYFNQGAEQIFGYRADEILGRPLEELLPERFRATHAAHVERFGSSPEHARRMGERRQISGLRKGGEEFPAEASISRYRVGERTVFNVVLRDISERKRAEDHARFLAEAGELLAGSLDLEVTVREAARLAVPALGDGCVIELLDGAHQVVAQAIAHRDPERERMVAELRRRYPPDPRAPHPFAEAIRRRSTLLMAEIGDAQRRELARDEEHYRLIRAVGATTAIITPFVVRDRTLGVLTLFRSAGTYRPDDVVRAEDYGRRIGLALENARLYDTAQRAIRARDETVGILSHELRNPVHAIGMIAANVLDGPTGAASPPELAEQIRVIGLAARQADRLIMDLLDVTRIESGTLRLAPDPVEVRAIVDSATDVLAPLVAERELTLDVALPSDLPEVLADAERVQQVVANLVGNAVKFTPRGGRITLRAERAGHEVVVAVADTGRGIPAAQLPYIFDRFWQAHHARRAGAGLGLAIARGIVEGHGGRLWAESVEGAGTVFRFTLPVA